MPPNTVVVSRPSKWGNPFKIGETYSEYQGLKNIGKIMDANEAVFAFMDWRELNPLSECEVNELRGKNLACWCPIDKSCHGNVLLEMVNQ